MNNFCCCCNLEKESITIYNGFMICNNCYGNFLQEECYAIDEVNIFIHHVQIGEHKLYDVPVAKQEQEEKR